MTRKLLFIAVATALLAACGNYKKDMKTITADTERNAKGDSMDIIGKTLVLKYDNGMTAEVSYQSKNRIHWKTTEQGKVTGESDEAAVYTRLNTYQFFLSWIEADGSTVSQVIDLRHLTVTTFLSYADKAGRGGRASSLLTGTVTPK